MKLKKVLYLQKINILLVVFDILLINISMIFNLLLRFDFIYSEIPVVYINNYITYTPIYTLATIGVFYLLKMYKVVWKYVGVNELFRALEALIITTFLHVLVLYIFNFNMPLSYLISVSILQFVLTTGIRISYRIYLEYVKDHKVKSKQKKVLIIGAGDAGRLVLTDINNHKNRKYVVRGFIDDNKNKWGRYIDSIPVVGGRTDIAEKVEELDIDVIMICMPSAPKREKQEIIDICKELNISLKILPDLGKVLADYTEGIFNHLKDVQIEDLLGRKAIEVNSKETLKNITGKVVLVTGGGGTIGSELCRQIAKNNPKKLIIFDIYENNAYYIEQELKRNYPSLDYIALIGSVRDAKRLDDVFNEYRPNIVYHAAAHKHVPLMETSPNEAIKNNVYGTYNTAFAALRYKVNRFILISTDKAVNPTSVMGATKRICEMVIQSMSKVSKTKDISHLPKLEKLNHFDLRPYDTDFITDYVAVRFGNVLGSNGSVIPLFKKQISEGGPLTVTHKDIIRYFMTIPEAVGLVIESGFYAKGGEIFVLDMGEPVKIDTLARNLIKLSGLRPDIDIEIKYTGLRPGEKLYEEKLMAEEGLSKTDNDLIHVAKPLDFSIKEFFSDLQEMSDIVSTNDTKQVLKKMTCMVPTYRTSEEDLKQSKEKFKKMYNTSK